MLRTIVYACLVTAVLLVGAASLNDPDARQAQAMRQDQQMPDVSNESATIEVLTGNGYRPVHYNFMQIDTLDGDSVRILIDPFIEADSFKVLWALDYYVPTDSFVDISASFPDLDTDYADTANLVANAGNVHFRLLAFQGADTLLLKHAIMFAYDDPEWPVMSVTEEEDTIVGFDENQMVAGNIVVTFGDSVVSDWGTPDSTDLAMTTFFRENQLMPIGTCRDLNFVLTYTFDGTFPTGDTAALEALAETLYTDNSDIVDEVSPNWIFQDDLTVATEDIPQETRSHFQQGTQQNPEGNFKPPDPKKVLANSFHLFITETYAGHRLARKAADLGTVTDVWLAVLDRGFGDGQIAHNQFPGIRESRIKKPTALDDKNRIVSYEDHEIENVEDKENSHGTKVSMTAVGDGEFNGGVIRGTGPDVILMPVKRAGDYAKIAAHLDYIKNNKNAQKVKVINLSSGHWCKKPINRPAKALKTVVKAICDSGIVLVVSTGNEDYDITSRMNGSTFKVRLPCSLAPRDRRVNGADTAEFSTLMAVAATDGTDEAYDQSHVTAEPRVGEQEKRVSWCGFGDPVSVAAPGQDIRVQKRDGELTVRSGTSYSAPIVAGLITEMMMLDKALPDDPHFSPVDIVEIVEFTADSTADRVEPLEYGKPTQPSEWVGHGRINVWKAILAVVNRGIASWNDACASEFGALGADNFKDDAHTEWYGFRVHLGEKNQNATGWLRTTFSGGLTRIEDTGNTQKLGSDVELRYPTAYKGVQRDASDPWSLPFGYTKIGNTHSRDFLALFSIKRTDLQDPSGGYQTLEFRKRGCVPAKIPVLEYPKEGGLNLQAMRGSSPPKGCSFEHFIFTIDPIKVTLKDDKRLSSIQAGEPLDILFDLEISNPDSVREIIQLSVEACLERSKVFLGDTCWMLFDTTFLSIPPGDTILAEAAHLQWPPGLDIGDWIAAIASLEPATDDYISRDIYYEINYPPYVNGDANGDGVVDVGDIVYLVNYLYREGSDPDPLESGDANCDGVVDVGDVVYLINYLFRGGLPPDC